MRKSTLVLITIAALGLGSLVGFSLVSDDPSAASDEPVGPITILETGGAPRFRYLDPGDISDEQLAAGGRAPFSVGENFVANDKAWKTETLTIALAGDSRVEYKIFMSQGDAVVFNWSVDGEEVYYDFHAHDEAFGEDFYTRYDDGQGARRSGAIVAAYNGQHGWYWQNLEPDAETITLEVAGFYDDIVEMDLTAK